MPEPPRRSLIDETETQPIAAIRPVAESGLAPVARPVASPPSPPSPPGPALSLG